jgi:hypothetical protein
VRPWLSLDGEWEFELDSADAGQQARWFTRQSAFTRKILVPGAWEAQGVGEPGMSQPIARESKVIPLKHRYRGVAWYRKTFRVPAEWKGKAVWLKVGGVNSQASFWINGEFINSLNTYCGTYKFEIARFLQAGDNVITARVTNQAVSRKGLVNWREQFGGFYRSVELEATAFAYIDDVWVRPDFDGRRALVQVDVARIRPASDGAHRVMVRVSTPDGRRAGEGEVTIPAIASMGTEVTVPVALDPFLPWSPEHPNLYKADVRLEESGQTIDGWVERFGVRKLERHGADLYLNGKRYFLRGFGDDYVYPLTLASPASREEHRKHLQLAHAYGFNYIRNHTHTENPEYYEAADEAGILIQPELPYYGNRPSQGEFYGPLDDLNELFRHFRRFTSLASYSGGNEGLHAAELRETLYRLAKLLDPSRLVVHQDGILPQNGPVNYDGIADLRGGPTRVPIKPESVGGSMPVILHEFLNLTGPVDARLEPQFTGAEQSPLRLSEAKEAAEKAGVGWELATRCVDAGHELQAINQKIGVEHARALKDLDGYIYWTIVDVDARTPQGLLDMFWRPKRSRAGFFRQFNAATVLLLPGLSVDGDDRVFASGSPVSLPVSCSNYSESALNGASVTWSVLAGGRVESQGKLAQVDIPQGTVAPIGKVEFAMPRVNRPAEVTLRLEIAGQDVRNEWKFYAFPENRTKVQLGRASPSEPLLTERLDAAAMKTLAGGGKVLLLSLADFTPVQPGWRLGWWQPNDQRGTAMAASEAFGEFPSEAGLPSFAWFRVFRDAAPMNDRLENHIDPLMVTIGKDGYLTSVFQARVGPGKLFATGLDLRSGNPEAGYLLDQFLKYMRSNRFEPSRSLPPESLRALSGRLEGRR